MATTRINAVSATATTFAGDDFLPIDGNVNATRRLLLTSLFASPSAIGSVTPAAGAFTTGTFSSTLGVTGVATLGNGAILGTPASGTVTNLTGTASININGTVGATTPSTVAATSGTFSGSVTLANGQAIRGTTTTPATGQILTLSGDNNIYIGAVDVGGNVIVRANAGSTVATFTSTGLNSTAIGATTPSTGAFTTISATTTGRVGADPGYSQTFGVTGSIAATTNISVRAAGSDTIASGPYFALGPTSGQTVALQLNAANALDIWINPSTWGKVATFTSTGAAITGTLSATGNATFTGNTLTVGSVGRTVVKQTVGGDTEIGGAAGSNTTDFLANGIAYARLSSTGLAVTGALSATTNGTQLSLQTSSDPTNYKTTITSPYDSANPFILTGTYNGSAADWLKITAGGGYTSPKLIIGNTMTTVDTKSGTSTITSVSSTGLAVTGTLSATGNTSTGGTLSNAVGWNNISQVIAASSVATSLRTTTGTIRQIDISLQNDNNWRVFDAIASADRLSHNGTTFAVTGNLTVSTDAYFNGPSTGDIYMKGGSINFASTLNSSGTGYLNYYGYNGAFTQFRSLNIGDGKNNTVAVFSTTGLAVTGELAVTGSGAFGGGVQANVRLTTFSADQTTSTYSFLALDSNGNTALVIYGDRGVALASPTGGSKGAGTLNVAGDIYKNNTAYTNPDYVIEKWATGSIVKYADKVGAKEYNGLQPLSAVEAYAKEKFHLPRFGQNAEHGIFSGSDALLASVEEAYLYLFQQDAELQSLRKRLAALESK